jgi:hypothetical protein
MSETTTTPSLVVVRPFLMQALLNIMSTEETRYYLRGVLIEPHKDGGIVLTATDGHVLVTMHDQLGFAQGTPQIWAFRDHAALVKAEISTASKYLKNKALLKYQQVESKFQVSVGYADSAEEMLNMREGTEMCKLVSYNAAIDGTFPEYRRIVSPVGSERAGTCIQAAILARIAKFAQDLIGNKGAPVNLELTSEKGPSHIHIKADGEFVDAVGIVMPMRAERMLHHPAWICEHLERPELGAQPAEELRPRTPSKEDADYQAAQAA